MKACTIISNEEDVQSFCLLRNFTSGKSYNHTREYATFNFIPELIDLI